MASVTLIVDGRTLKTKIYRKDKAADRKAIDFRNTYRNINRNGKREKGRRYIPIKIKIIVKHSEDGNT